MQREYNLAYTQSLWHILPKLQANEPIYGKVYSRTKYTSLRHARLVYQTIYKLGTIASTTEQVYILTYLSWLHNKNSWYHLDALKSTQ